jgi:hypothetical protein
MKFKIQLIQIMVKSLINDIDNKSIESLNLVCQELKTFLKGKIDDNDKINNLIDLFIKDDIEKKITNLNDSQIKKKVITEGQSQKHGFTIENEIRKKVFDLEEKSNDTNTHDISKYNNKFDSNENISIKATKSNNIDCGDIMRFFNYNFIEKNTIIVVKYEQCDDTKKIKIIYEIDYCKDLHKKLFGNVTYQILEEYVNNVKKIPRKTSGDDAKIIYDYLNMKNKIKKDYNMMINISPKVDSKQSRVQCSLPKFEELCKDFIKYTSTECIIRSNKIFDSIISGERNRNPKH